MTHFSIGDGITEELAYFGKIISFQNVGEFYDENRNPHYFDRPLFGYSVSNRADRTTPPFFNNRGTFSAIEEISVIFPESRDIQYDLPRDPFTQLCFFVDDASLNVVRNSENDGSLGFRQKNRRIGNVFLGCCLLG